MKTHRIAVIAQPHAAADAVGQAGGIGTQAAKVVALVALLRGNAQHHVADIGASDADFVERSADDVAAHRGRFGVVKRAAKGFANGRAGGGNNDGVSGVHANTLNQTSSK